MTLKKLSIVTNGLIFLSVLGMCVALYMYDSALKTVDATLQQREMLLTFGDELRQSSANLTSNVRMYAVTGNKKYEDAYNAVLDERSAKIPRFKERKFFPGEKHAITVSWSGSAQARKKWAILKRLPNFPTILSRWKLRP